MNKLSANGQRIGDSGGLESQNFQSYTKLSNSLLLFSKFKKKGNIKGCCDKKRRNLNFSHRPPFRQYDVTCSFYFLICKYLGTDVFTETFDVDFSKLHFSHNNCKLDRSLVPP